MQHLIEGVPNSALRREISIIYASDTTVAAPPTVESLRFTTRELQRNRPKQSQFFDQRYAMRSRPHSSVLLQPNKMVLPQGVLPSPPPSKRPADPAAAPSAVCAPLSACFNCGQTRHFARNCPNRDQAHRPTVNLRQ